MKYLRFKFLLILFTTIVAVDMYAGPLESAVKKARTTKPKGVIKLHPQGKDGGMIPLKAFQMLKPGMTLQLLPAEYWETIEVQKDRITVTTDNKRINYSVVLKGRDCVVKNTHCNNITMVDDGIILDSVVGEINIGNWSYESKIKLKVYVYNTALNHLRTLGGENNTYTVELKNCLVKGGFTIPSNTKMTITDSVLLSDGFVFNFSELWNSKKGRLLLKNNLILGKSGYARMDDSPNDKKRGVRVLDPKDIRKIWSTNFSGEHVHEEPKFQTDRKLFLTEDSPGKGRGLIPEEHPAYEEPKKAEDPEDIDKDDPEDKDKNEGLSDEDRRRREKMKEWRRRQEERRREREEREKHGEKPPEKDPVKDPVDDGDFGGIPKPPE